MNAASYISDRSMPEPNSGCLLWLGSVDRGEDQYAARLSEGDVRDILASTESGRALASKYGGTFQTISDIRRRKRWAHLSGKAALSGHARGERSGKSKITADDVRAIRASSAPLKDEAARYGVAPAYISQIRHRKTWRHIE